MRVLKFEKRALLWLVLALILSAGVKTWLVLGDVVPFNSDEAIVALMGRHILMGERPVFFYGQAYMGSLDAFLVAGAYRIFGEGVWVIRLVQGALYLGVLGTTAWLGKVAYGSWSVGSMAALLLAIPTVNVNLYTTVSLGGYGEALLIGNLLLIGGLKISGSLVETDHPGSYWSWLIVGFLCGFGVWAFGITLVYSIPVGIFLLIHLCRWVKHPSDLQVSGGGVGAVRTRVRGGIGVLALFTIGVLIGSAPWWGFALDRGFDQLVYELRGGAIAGVEGLPWLLLLGRHFLSLVLLGWTVVIGLRPPWDVTWLAMPLVPLILAFWMGVVVYTLRILRKGRPHRNSVWLLVGVVLTLVLAFLLTPFGADPSGRYFLPMAVPMALFAAAMILDLKNRFGGWVYGLVALLLVFQFWGTLQSVRRFPPGVTTQFYEPAQVDHRHMDELVDFLNQHGESYGYTNYWVSYPLAFRSREKLIYVPRLPYHPDFRYTDRDDRYAPYGEKVAKADRVAYITTNHPALDDYLRESFSTLGVTWQETRIEDYVVFYELSRVVRPKEIGLGRSFP